MQTQGFRGLREGGQNPVQLAENPIRDSMEVKIFWNMHPVAKVPETT